METITGILHTVNYIDFQLVSTNGLVLHTFTGASYAIPCLPGDTCTWENEHCVLVSRKTHPPLTGILHLQSKYRYGMTSRGSPLYLFTPLLAGYPPMIAGCSYKNSEKNMLAIVDFDTWAPRMNDPNNKNIDNASAILNTHARCNLRTMIGPCGDRSSEEKAILEAYAPYKIPSAWKSNWNEEDIINKGEDRISLPANTFHIDPAGCTDIDDVISIEYKDGKTYIWITISDVDAVVEPGSREDIYAATMCQTMYSLDGKVLKPMLPSYYSDDLCSLLPGKPRLGISLICSVNADGSLTSEKLCKTRVHVSQFYSYESVMEDKAFPRDLFARITESILGTSADYNDSHTWIEALMIYYNSYIACLLCTIGRGVLRAHDGINPVAYELLRGLGDNSLYVYANYAAKYVEVDGIEENKSHKSLGIDSYCHATSPIRRYADLINQRIIKAYLDNVDVHAVIYSIHQLQLREKDNKRYTRDSQLLTCVYDNTDKMIHASILQLQSVGDNRVKITAWVREWKKRISWVTYSESCSQVNQDIEQVQIQDITSNTTIPIKIYETIQLTYKTQPNQIRWKDRILFKIVDGDN